MLFDDPAYMIVVALCITIAINVYLSWKDRQTQIKIHTAKIFLDIINSVKEDKRITDLIKILLHSPNKNINFTTASPFLSMCDFVATLWNGKTLDDAYAKSFFKQDFEKIKQNTSLVNIIKTTDKQTGELPYPNLNKYLKITTS